MQTSFRKWRRAETLPQTFELPAPLTLVLTEWAKERQMPPDTLLQEIVVWQLLNHYQKVAPKMVEVCHAN